MTRATNRSSITDAKNALRPFFNRAVHEYAKKKKPVSKSDAFQAVRLSTLPRDYEKLYELVEESRFYEFKGLGNSFPKERRQIPDPSLSSLKPIESRRELDLQVKRLNHHSARLRQALIDIADLNDCLQNTDWDNSERLITSLYDEYGYSISVVKKDLLTAFQRNGLIGLSKRYSFLTDGYDGTAWKLLCAFYHDLVDPAYQPSRSTKVWLSGLSAHGNNSSWYSAPLIWHIVGLPGGDKFTTSQALRFNGVSLIDQILFLWSLSQSAEENELVAFAMSRVKPDITEILLNRFSHLKLPVPGRYKNSDGMMSDISLFRTSFFFSEIANISVWKGQVSELLFADAETATSTVSKLNPLISHSMRDAVEYSRDPHAQLSGWTITSTGVGFDDDSGFFRALTASDTIRKYKTEDRPDTQILIKLLSDNKELQDYISAPELLSLSGLAEERQDLLVAYLLRDLTFKRHRSPDNDLERRAAFMALFLGEEHEAIVKFVVEQSAFNTGLADYIFNACSRVFLERLYLPMSSVKDVLETRVSLCEWYLQSREPSSRVVNEELKALREELVNLDARSDLDSTRVHVDEEALREWFNDTQYGRVARYTQTVQAEDSSAKPDSFLSLYNKLIDDSIAMDVSEDLYLNTQIGSQFVLLQIIEDTLKAFVSDRSFGMDAYLSRRIRHGTLGGFLITPVSRIVQRIDEDEQERGDDGLSQVKIMIEEWRTYIISKIDFMRRELIQIRSTDHPEALIDPTWRLPSGVTYLDAATNAARSEILIKGKEYDLFADIHALCWDLIERDLAKVRLYLLKDFAKETSEMMAVIFDRQPFEIRNLAAPYVRDAQQSFIKRIQEVCGWFIRPVRRRDSYDLTTLIGSMTSIIKELDATFDFQDNIFIDQRININRGTFEVLGDTLFVLIGNAAKHGKRGGMVSVSAVSRSYSVPHVMIAVTSETADASGFDLAVDSIKNALKISDSSDLDVAAVQEGFSGIRKIVGLLARIRAPGERLRFLIDRDALTLTFEIDVPASILFKQERA